MSIWNKILLGCIFVTATALFFLSSRALIVHQTWRQKYDETKSAIEEQELRAVALIEGDESTMGLREARLELYKVLIGRGRVWQNCRPMNVQKDTHPTTKAERVQILVQSENPDSVESESVLYAFEEKSPADGGQYLGQFTVAGVSGNQVQLQPSRKLSDEEFARVQASQQAAAQDPDATWRLYELMPTDSHDVFAALSEDDLKTLFPESCVAEYIHDGKMMLKSDAEQAGFNGAPLSGNVIMVDEAQQPVFDDQGIETLVEDGNGMFVRRLRDYEILFDEFHRLRAEAEARMKVAERDKQFMDDSKADARLQQAARQKEIQDLQQDLTGILKERDAVQGHEKSLDTAIASMKNAIAQLTARSEAMIAQVAQIQRNAAQIINNRTRGVVQTEAP